MIEDLPPIVAFDHLEARDIILAIRNVVGHIAWVAMITWAGVYFLNFFLQLVKQGGG